MRGTMHFSEDVERVMNDMLANFRSKLLSLPTRVSPILVCKDNVVDIQEVLHKQILEVLQELSNYDPEKFYNEKYIDIEDDELAGELSGQETSENKDKDN